jgi:2-polyprenyl-6-hydroxyphenyl methylase/3-demethylubiquinone-9 3-methyltransferase
MRRARPLLPRFLSSGTSADASELRRFAALSPEWWRDPSRGAFAALHAMNAVRVPLVARALRGAFLARRVAAVGDAAIRARPLAGLDVLDVGCGGGILSAALARLGARVRGVDLSDAGVRAARGAARADPALAALTDFRVGDVADVVGAAGERFDGVVCSEVAEHVGAGRADAFLRACARGVRAGGGVLVVTTINRTPTALGAAILGAEYIAKLAPRGTHEWAKFVTPDEVADAVTAEGLCVETQTGLFFNPLSGEWSRCADTSVNYALVARRA